MLDEGGQAQDLQDLPGSENRKVRLSGTKGQKLEWEMVPMGELFVEEGTIPGDSPHTLSGADGTIWHPTGRWAATVVRLCGGICILDAENNFSPVAFLGFNKDRPTSIRSSASTTITGRSSSTGFIRRDTRSGSRRMVASCA